MKYDCNVVKDLLPLYQDNICSSTSKDIVEEHLRECADCKKVAEQMSDGTVEKTLTVEKNHVLEKHRKNVNRKTTTIGIATAGILMIPVIVCLICNIAIGHALDWFFIVLTAMLLVASLIVVPFIVEKDRLVWVVLSATGSLLLLLLTCCIYTRGDWFFVAASGCIFGISCIFSPFVVSFFCRGEKLKNHKAVLTILWDILWLYILLVVCGVFVGGGSLYWEISMTVTTYAIILVCLFVVIIRYGRKNGWIKAGVLVILTGLWIGLSNDVMNLFIGPKTASSLKYVDLSKGFQIENQAVFNANIYFMVIAVSIFVGGILIGIGIGKDKKERKMQQ